MRRWLNLETRKRNVIISLRVTLYMHGDRSRVSQRGSRRCVGNCTLKFQGESLLALMGLVLAIAAPAHSPTKNQIIQSRSIRFTELRFAIRVIRSPLCHVTHIRYSLTFSFETYIRNLQRNFRNNIISPSSSHITRLISMHRRRFAITRFLLRLPFRDTTQPRAMENNRFKLSYFTV